MSSQGTGSIGDDFTYTIFLEAWGDWARDGINTAGMRKSVQYEQESLAGLGWLFTDGEMCVIDGIIAKMPVVSKGIIKRAHLKRCDLFGEQQLLYRDAVRLFVMRIEEARERGDIEITFLDK